MSDYDDQLAAERERSARLIAQLRESEARFRAIADTMPQMVWSTTPDGLHDYYNARWYEFTGVPAGSTDGEGWNAMFHPADQERAWSRWRASLASGDPYEIEYRLRHHGGAYRWVLGRALPIRDTAGRITRWFGTCTDIHEQILDKERGGREKLRLELALDAGAVGTWLFDADRGVFEGDARCGRILGLASATALDLERHVIPALAAEQRAGFARALAGAVTAPIDLEVRVVTAEGDRWVAWTGRAVVEGGRGRLVVGTVRDISAERAAAAEREIITQELSHRIKNIFSIISGMIALSARAHPEIKPLAGELRDRIAALGQAHEFVRTKSLTVPEARHPATLHGLLSELLAPYGRAGGAGVTVTGDDAAIDDRSVTPLALVFHELMTNAAKYGGLAEDAGGVAVRTREEGETLVVEWAEDAGEKPLSPPSAPGFGSRLTELSISNQLGGGISRDWSGKGLVCRIDIPLRALSRSPALPTLR